ncbi:hypothetical protein Tco_0115189, partial [Tanacetum coccineum]
QDSLAEGLSSVVSYSELYSHRCSIGYIADAVSKSSEDQSKLSISNLLPQHTDVIDSFAVTMPEWLQTFYAGMVLLFFGMLAAYSVQSILQRLMMLLSRIVGDGNLQSRSEIMKRHTLLGDLLSSCRASLTSHGVSISCHW